MIKVEIKTELIEWLREELNCGPETAVLFAASFVSELEAGGGLTEVSDAAELRRSLSAIIAGLDALPPFVQGHLLAVPGLAGVLEEARGMLAVGEGSP
jgi:hypothetical protein